MADMFDETLSPTFQRNKLDAAIDLVNIQWKLGGLRDFNDIEKTFAKYYALVTICEGADYEELENLVSDELKKKLAGDF